MHVFIKKRIHGFYSLGNSSNTHEPTQLDFDADLMQPAVVGRAQNPEIWRCVGTFVARMPTNYFQHFAAPPCGFSESLSRCADQDISRHVRVLQDWKLLRPQDGTLDWLFSYVAAVLHARPGNVPITFFTHSNRRPLAVLSDIALSSKPRLQALLACLKSDHQRTTFQGTADWLKSFAVSLVFFRACLPITRTCLATLREYPSEAT